MSPRDRWLPLLAPGLLIALALTQIGLSMAVGLSPWKGGGFGMFSSTDWGGFRSLSVTAVSADGETPLAVGMEWNRERRAARILPDQTRLLALAEGLSAEAPAGTRQIRIVVERAVFDPETLEPHREEVARIEHLVEPRSRALP